VLKSQATLTTFFDNHLNGSVRSKGLSRSKSFKFYECCNLIERTGLRP